MRHHVHCAITDESYLNLDPFLTVSVTAESDFEAQEKVMAMLPGLEFDVIEIDTEEDDG